MKIGLEVHAYPLTESKMYCSCGFSSEKPNTSICPICTGQPGSKPMATNEKAVRNCLIIGKALNCRLLSDVQTMRKHYFYPDIPNNYQRTSTPFAEDGEFKGVKIREIHWEEDPGKYDLRKGTVDLNRSGTPLVEIVTDPDIKSPEQAKEFLDSLSHLLSFLGVARKGFKVDTNISMGSERVEVKNINSITGVVNALEFEIKRQSELIEKGESVKRETRHFDEQTGKTISLRVKEAAEDYRFIPDPDLPAVCITGITIPEFIDLETALRGLRDKGLSDEEACVITSSKAMFELFEELARDVPVKLVTDWMKTDLLGELNYRGITLEESKASIQQAKDLLIEFNGGKITKLIAKEKLRALLDGREAKQSGKASLAEVESAASKVIKENAGEVEKYKAGKKQVINFLLGEVQKKLGYSADPKRAISALKKKLV